MTPSRHTRLLLFAAALPLAAGTGVVALAALVAHRVIHPQRAKPTQILRVTDDEVTLSSTELTRAPGVLGLLYDEERHLAVLAPRQLQADDNADTVDRRLQKPAEPAVAPGLGRATGNVFATPDELGQDLHEISLLTPLGPAPAWIFGAAGSETWLVHIHGSLTGREGALRSVDAARHTGFPSLVPSFRGDGQGPPAPRNAFMLGQTEWHDLEPALDYVIEQGARRIVLVGWSNGASMALRLPASSKHRAAIAGVVAVSPVLDWASTIRLSARAAHVPELIAGLALRLLREPTTSALLGAPEPVHFNDLSWTSTRVPMLILHSAGDRTTSYAVSVAFRDRSPQLVTLPELPPVPHALEWNADPAWFGQLLVDWLKGLPSPTTPG